ncbi:MAG: DNA polymerase I [bacterium]|nr:DNA polymerase I [bacterium]
MTTLSRPLFYLVDGYALAYRYYFASRERAFMTAAGEGTSAVFGFTRMLMDLLEKEKPAYLAVAFDAGMSGRDTLFEGYKGTREQMPDELERQIARIEQMVKAFNIPALAVPGYEADDVIGTVSRQAEAEALNVRIFSGDRDLLQLLSDHITVRLFVPMAKVQDAIYDQAAFREKYAFEPHQFIDYKALVGDTSDNIPGVAGIGEKTATSLLQTYGSLENIYANLDAHAKGLRQKLVDGREMAFLSQKLATIQRDVPITLDKARCITHAFERSGVEALFRELEFNSLYAQLGRLGTTRPNNGSQLPLFALDQPAADGDAVGESDAPAATVPTTIVDTPEKLAALVETLNGAALIAFDTESTSTDKMLADLVGISLAVEGESGYYIPVGHHEGQQLRLEAVLDALRPPLTNPNIPKTAHNAVYDLVVMQRHGIDVTPIAFDTMVAEWVRDPLSDSLGLKRLARARLGKEMIQIETLIGKGKAEITMAQVSIDTAAQYAAADAAFTLQLVEKLRPDLEPTAHEPEVDALWGTPNPPTPRDVFMTLEMPLIPVLATIVQAGVLLDVPYLRAISVRLNERLASLQDEIEGLAGGYGHININSPKQLNDVLFGKLGIKPAGLRKTTHGFSTDAATLEELRDQHPIIEKILEYRELSKLQGTYVDALPALIHPATGRVHTDFNQTGASTGRMSSSNPNLQNIPIRTEIGREVRGAFIAPPGYKLLSVDYSQVELRIMAHITKEPTLLEAFQQGQDIHAATAAVIYNVPLAEVTKTQRIFAKRVNFGILYGMGAFRLARDSDLTRQQAQAFIDAYFARLPGVKRYIDGTIRLAREQQYLTTLFGRRRKFPGLFMANRNQQAASEREAINMPIQGTAADIMKRAMIRLHDELQRRTLGARLILQVHDELVLEVPDETLHETAALVVETMESAAQLDAPLKANAQYGQNWRDLTEISA